MKIKIWNKEAVPSNRSTGLFIRVAPKSGTITLSQDLFNHVKMKGLNFIQDEERPMDWYLQPSNEETAFIIRNNQNTKMESGYVVQNSAISREILKSNKLENLSTRFMVSPELTEGAGYAIITKSAKK